MLGIGIGIYQQCDVVHVWYWSIRELKEKMPSLQPTKDGDATEIEGIYNQQYGVLGFIPAIVGVLNATKHMMHGIQWKYMEVQ